MKELTTRSDDGTKIRFGRWNEDGEKDLLIVHGLAEHLGRYQHIGEFYAAKGWRVTVIELRGHGQSEGRRGHVDMWLRYREDLQSVMACVGRPMAILAHSMGGLVTLYSLQSPLTPEVRCIALSNPPLGLFTEPPKLKIKAGEVLSKIWPTFRMWNEVHAEHISRDPKVVSDYLADPLVYDKITTRWAAEFLKSMAEVNAYAANFTVPMMMNLGTGDQTCSTDTSKKFQERYGGDSTLNIYEKLYHELMNEPEKEQVMTDIDTWLSQYFSG